MNRVVSFAFAALSVLSVTACTTPAENGAEHLYDVEAIYPIKVEPQVATLVVQADLDGGSLMRGEEERIAAFAEQWKARGQGKMSAASPSGSTKAANVAMQRIQALLVGNGVDKRAIQLTTYDAATGDASAPITLSFVTFAATTAECGEAWPSNLAHSPRNLPYAGFGCTSQHNFAAMVADPRDLTEPRTQTPADAERRSTIFDKYRKGLPTMRSKSDLDSGVVSDVKE